MKIAIFAAGTGGHIYPALSIAENFKKEEVLFFASSRKLEKDIFAKTNYQVIHLGIEGFRGKSVLKKIIFPLTVSFNLFMVLFELIRFKPSKILILGGYISILGLLASKILFKPLFLHEQNSILGTTNKIASHFTKKNFTAFKIGIKKEKNLGNPIRNQFFKDTYLSNPIKNKILVLGGSQGSKFFNENLPKILMKSEITEKIIFQTGNQAHLIDNKKIQFRNFIDNLPELFSQTKFVICRSGASTVSELQAYGMPALLFPLPNSIDDHQKINAESYSNNDSEMVFNEKDFSPEDFLERLNRFNSRDLKELSKRIKKDLHCDAAIKIANEIKQN